MSEERPVKGTFADAFDEALAASGTTLSGLRTRLAERGHKVAASTLGYWRSGARQPERAESLDAVAEIEALLRVKPGSLLRAIGATRRTGPPVPRASVEELPMMSPAMTDALATLDMDSLRPGHLEETLDIAADLDASGGWTRMTSRSRLRATSDGIAHSTMYCQSPPECMPTELAVVAGATLGRVVRLEEHGLVVGELLFERPLDTGDTAMVEYTFAFSGQDDPELGTFVPNRMSHVSVWVRFSRERTPRRAWRYTHRAGDEPERTEVAVAGTSSLHHTLRSFGPGAMSVEWEW